MGVELEAFLDVSTHPYFQPELSFPTLLQVVTGSPEGDVVESVCQGRRDYVGYTVERFRMEVGRGKSMGMHIVDKATVNRGRTTSCTVEKLEDGFEASRVGVRVGDVVVGLGGRDVSCLRDVKDAIEDKVREEGGGEIEVVVKR